MARRLLIGVLSVMACGGRGAVPLVDGGGGVDAGPGPDSAVVHGEPGAADAGPDAGGAVLDAAPSPPVDAAIVAADAASADLVSADPSTEFRILYETVLRPKCGGVGKFGQGCHVSDVMGGKLSMPDVLTAYANLVNRTVVCPDYPQYTGKQIRVIPFDPMNSVVMYANGDGPCGRRHGSFYLQDKGYTAADQSALEAWIRKGAL